ncbi:hypothetical protein A4D02_00035 [Niastella koreensis]|uniref:Modification methylase NspV n=2 Tax=Niastella koreensis TaxID=354356 RepID=G8TA02_NIAKG|nr:modification methylase NspV [Niastella koreensis]AEW02374.1 modification methylase NspV [Niastella koreensis GR20-10]OQP54753.1 hypothetical protein A4D02_00035 [Niastella koreensis]
MKFFGANISETVLSFLECEITRGIPLSLANDIIQNACGIIDFIKTEEELHQLSNSLVTHQENDEPDRSEYGDFQTNFELALAAVSLIKNKTVSPDVVVEPTCGVGNFILTALHQFETIQFVHAVEIYKPYIYETQFKILDFFLNSPGRTIPEIIIHHCNVFDFDFSTIANSHQSKQILIIGNPPWITNAKLSTLNSSNLPEKVNFKKHQGLDAITGKGNFDLAENISLMMLNSFRHNNGYLALLVKSSVIKNILYDQRKNNYSIQTIEQYKIDSKKEFNAAVDAALFACKTNSAPEYVCTEYDLYNPQQEQLKFGWLGDKFVSNLDEYIHTCIIDGACQFIWRQGLKHDCSAIMELDKINGHYFNSNNEKVVLEEDLVYGLLKSSDLKSSVINKTRKYTIVTQKKPGQDTSYIETSYPGIFNYLNSNKEKFDARKSSIYKGKPAFSIFGIGDYSFKTYKVAISGLYKTFHFTLITPQNDKSVMLDDTCYFIGFDNVEFAAYSYCLLNSSYAFHFLKSITFKDAKRIFTKDILMRIDMYKLARAAGLETITNEINKLNNEYALKVHLNSWDAFLEELNPTNY